MTTEDNELEKKPNKNICILIFRCSYCGEELDTFQKNISDMTNSDSCPKCKHNYSRCSVCSHPIKVNECLVYCTKCSHGGHYEHYQDWFREITECPNSKCSCRCSEDIQLNDKIVF